VLDAARPAIQKTLNNQKEISTPQPPQGGAKIPMSKIYCPETDSKILIISEPILGLQSELYKEKKLNPPLGGMGGGNSVLMDFINL
jgi:hypothetical protein